MSSTVSGPSGTAITGESPRRCSSDPIACTWKALLPVKLQWLTSTTFLIGCRAGPVSGHSSGSCRRADGFRAKAWRRCVIAASKIVRSRRPAGSSSSPGKTISLERSGSAATGIRTSRPRRRLTTRPGRVRPKARRARSSRARSGPAGRSTRAIRRARASSRAHRGRSPTTSSAPPSATPRPFSRYRTRSEKRLIELRSWLTKTIVLPSSRNRSNVCDALLLELCVADREHLVEQQDVEVDLDRDRVGEPHLHARTRSSSASGRRSARARRTRRSSSKRSLELASREPEQRRR